MKGLLPLNCKLYRYYMVNKETHQHPDLPKVGSVELEFHGILLDVKFLWSHYYGKY